MDTHSSKEKNSSLTLKEENVDFKRAIELTGVGVFHVSLALVCGLSFLASGFQNSLNAFILPSVHCDLDITSSEMGLLNAMFLGGGICSAFLWGVVADLFGRRMVMVYGMLVDGLLTVASSFTQSYQLLIVFRFISGFVVGGPSSLVFAYMSEFFPERIRAKVICYVGVFWTLSWILLPAVAWVIIPIKWAYVTPGFHFNSWRMLVLIFAFPSLISAGLLYVYPESPRFILAKGKEEKALQVLAMVYSWNTKMSPSSYPVKSLLKEEHTTKDADVETSNKSVFKPVIILIKQIQQLFSFPTLKMTALACSLFFCNMFGYYGLGLWLPELFNRLEKHYHYYPDETVTLCEVKTSFPSDNSTITEAVCDSTAVDGTVFMKSVIMGVVGLFGNVMSGVLAGRLHRRTLPIVMMALAGTCVIIIYFLQGLTYNLAVTTGFQLFVGTANLLYNSLVVDMFPPSISGMGVCLGILSGRLGAMVSNLVFGNLLDVSCSVPIFMVAGINLAGSLFSALIPKYPYSEERISSKKSINLS